jgi:hypothetical protein
MPSVAIESTLFDRVEKIAQWKHLPAGELTEQALESFLDQLEWEKLDVEKEAYARLLPALLKTHEGEYVALHNGEVIASGPTLPELHLQVYYLLGNVPVLFKRVSAEPEPDLRIRSPRLSRPVSQSGLMD